MPVILAHPTFENVKMVHCELGLCLYMTLPKTLLLLQTASLDLTQALP